MSDKCFLCNEKLEETFLGKIDGTIIKIKDAKNKNQLYHICSGCQKSHKDIKEEVNKKLS